MHRFSIWLGHYLGGECPDLQSLLLVLKPALLQLNCSPISLQNYWKNLSNFFTVAPRRITSLIITLESVSRISLDRARYRHPYCSISIMHAKVGAAFRAPMGITAKMSFSSTPKKANFGLDL